MAGQNKNDRFYLQTEIDSYLRYILESDEWDILVLITKKGYWAYKLIVQEEKQKKLQNKYGRKRVLSDRYIMKCLDTEEFREKRIWLFDDTMTNGTNAFFFFSYLRKHGAEVSPHIFALSVDYPSDMSVKLLRREFSRVCRSENLTKAEEDAKAEKEIHDFRQLLKCRVRLNSADIAKLCVQEVQYFHKCLCPMVVDLPILSRMESVDGKDSLPAYMNGGTSGGIQMSLQQFELLKKLDSQWEFVDNHVVTEVMDINCSYFRYRDALTDSKSNSVWDMVIKCRYQLEEDSVRLVFVPFVIFKSMTFKDTIRCFFKMIQGEKYQKDYVKKVCHALHLEKAEDIVPEEAAENPDVLDAMSRNHNLCRNMFRTVIFCASDYIGWKFRTYVQKVTGISVDYDWDFLKDSFESGFIDGFHSNINEENYISKIHSLQETKKVSPIYLHETDTNQKIKAEAGEIEKYILGRLIEKRRAVDSEIGGRIYTLETIEAELDNNFIFENEEDRKRILTQSILSLLDTSRFGNEIYVDNVNKTIYRGFRYGENSELLFLKGMEYFCPFMVAYYYHLSMHFDSKEEVCRYYRGFYSEFMKHMEQYFRKEKYFEYLISGSTFDFLKDYYARIPDEKLEEQITNKMYVLDNYGDSKKDKGLKDFVDMAFSLTLQWMQWEGVDEKFDQCGNYQVCSNLEFI